MSTAQVIVKNVQEVKISKIVIDEDLYPRKQVVRLTVYSYEQAMRSGSVFPPIRLGQLDKKLYLVDGRHRLIAYQALGKTTVSAIIAQYKDRKALFLDAVKFNNTFGKSLTYEDKIKIYGTLKFFKMNNGQISALIHIPPEYFNTLISRYRTNEDTGKIETLSAVEWKAFHSGQMTEAEAYAIAKNAPRKDMMSQSALHAITDVVTLFERNLVPMSNLEVKSQCVKLSQILETALEVSETGDAA